MKLSILNKKITFSVAITIVALGIAIFTSSPLNVSAAQPISCPLRGGSGDILANFYSERPLFGTTAKGDVYRDYNIRVPVGEYKVTMTTYDDHSEHGGQNQQHEQVYVALRNTTGATYEGIVAQTDATRDIPENRDSITSTISSSLRVRTTTRILTVVHAAYPGGAESVVPICVLFEKLDEDEPEEPVNGICGSADGNTVSSQPTGSAACRVGTYSSGPVDTDEEYLWNCVGLNGGTTDRCSAYKEEGEDDLNVICRVSDTSVEVGDEVRFSAEVDGGNSPFEYEWDGDIEGEDDDTRDLYVEYNDEGTYRVSVTVTDDDGNTDSADCSTVRVDDDEDEEDFEITCRVSDTSVETGDEVEFTVDIDGGNGPFEYEWDGDIEDEDDDTRTLRVEYDDEGRYEVEITVTDDDGNEATDECSVVRVEDDDNNRGSIRVRTDNTPTGQLASLDSVFLNQVPSTGIKDARSIALFVSFLSLWSLIVGTYFYRRHQKSLRSAEIARFKALNRSK